MLALRETLFAKIQMRHTNPLSTCYAYFLTGKSSDRAIKYNNNNNNNNNNNKSIYIAPNQSQLLSGALQNMAN